MRLDLKASWRDWWTMGETVIGWLFLAIGTGLLIWRVGGRIFGFHRQHRWKTGGSVSLVGELSIAAFVLCGGLAVLQQTGAWVLLGVAAWIVGAVSERRASRRHFEEESALRKSGATRYPGVFDTPPPEDIDATGDDRFDLFDAGACTYLGRVAKSDLRELINRLKGMPDEGPNDKFMIHESLGFLHKAAVSPEFVALLDDAFRHRNFLVLRWLPSSRNDGEQQGHA